MTTLLLWTLVSEICWATVFGTPGDQLAGGKTLAGPYPRDIVGVAHRTAPMGSTVRITFLKEKMSMRLRVVDKGPWGKLDAQDKWFNACPGKQCVEGRAATKGQPWRGCVDLTSLAAKRLNLPARWRGKVRVQYRSRRRRW